MRFAFYILLLSSALFGCSQNIQLELPPHKSMLVVEFYLEAGQPLRCLLQESVSFTASPTVPLVSDALVVLSYNGTRDTLKNTLVPDTMNRKVYNYFLPKNLVPQPNAVYELYIRDSKGRELTGKTQFIDAVPIIRFDQTRNSKDSISVGVFFQDPPSVKNYYRLLAYKQSKKVKINQRADIDFPDTSFDGQEFGFYTDFVFAPKDTITTRVYHLRQEHYDYARSVERAIRANASPFAQPSVIRSNVTGGIGIFTTLNYAEKKDIILQ